MTVDKRILLPDGTQRHAHLGLIDGRGAFCFMLDSSETERFEFSGEAAYIGELEAEVRALKAETGALARQLDESKALASRLKETVSELESDLKKAREGKRGRKGGRR